MDKWLKMALRKSIGVTQKVVTATTSIALVQEKFYASSVNGLSHSVVANSTPVKGNMMILCGGTDDFITTPAGWTLAVSALGNSSNYIFYKVAGASESATITVAIGNSDTCCLYYAEVSGLPLNTLDQAGGLINQGATDIDSTTAITTQANEVVVAMAGLWINSFVQSITTTNNLFTFRGSVSSTQSGGGIDNVNIGIGILIVSATGSYQCTLTQSSSIGLNNCGLIAAFK